MDARRRNAKVQGYIMRLYIINALHGFIQRAAGQRFDQFPWQPKGQVEAADPGLVLAMRQMQLPGKFLDAFLSYALRKRHGELLGMW